jgi:hypothetical protein
MNRQRAGLILLLLVVLAHGTSLRAQEFVKNGTEPIDA